MRMCGVRACASIHFICVGGPLHHRAGRGEKGGGRRAVFLGADMHIMRAAHLNIGADDDDDRGILQNRLAQRRFAVVSSSSFVD